MIKVSLAQALEGTGVSPAALVNAENPNTAFPELRKKLEVLRLLPSQGQMVVLNVKGTSFADPGALSTAFDVFCAGRPLDLAIELEPENPRPPAFRIVANGLKLGYVAAEVADSLINRPVSLAGILTFEPIAKAKARIQNAYALRVLVGYGPIIRSNSLPKALAHA